MMIRIGVQGRSAPGSGCGHIEHIRPAGSFGGLEQQSEEITMATFNGTSGNDSLAGGTGNDLINGLAGNDTLGGNTGEDTLVGGLGNDTYRVNSLGDVIIDEDTVTGFAVNAGIDTVITSVLDSLKTYSLERWTFVENLTFGGTVAAQLKGNSLGNVIKSNSAATVNDTLYGGGGNDSLFSYAGNDSLIGDSGDDSLDGGTGNDMMIGGTGNDTYVIDAAGDRVFDYLNAGFDTIRSALFKDLRVAWTKDIEGLTWTNATTAATLHGNKLGNAITSLASGNDTLNGYEGNDTLEGGGGTDSLVGGLGNDQYRVSNNDVVKELVGEGIDTFVGAKTDISVTTNLYSTTIENLFYTGSAASAIKGNALDNLLSGGTGNDTVTGGDGNDSLVGSTGGDSLSGGNGEDRLYGGGLVGFEEAGGYVADAVRDTLAGGAGNDDYVIDSELDVISEATNGGTLDVVFSSIDNSLARYANVEALVLSQGSAAWFGQGGAGNDIIVGNGGSNYLDGGSGNDTLSGNGASTGFGGSDVIEGGAGNDVLVDFDFNSFISGFEETSLFGGAGNDLYILGDSLGSYGGLDTGGTDTALLLATGSIEGLEGVENVILFGTGAPEDARAETAIDQIYRAVFNTDYTSSILVTSFNQGATGNLLANRITGNAQNNALLGLEGNDTLLGGEGNDTLDGGTGNDSLVGGVGNDLYDVIRGDIVVEAVGGGFDIVRSATLTSYAEFANVEGLSYAGTNNVSLDNGSGNTSNDYFEGGSGNDTLQGFGGNDTLDGGTLGNDSILGGAGNDSLVGDQGNDTIDGGTGDDGIYGGQGVDSLLGGDGNDEIYVSDFQGASDIGTNTARGGIGNDQIYGASLNDKLYGDAGNDTLYGYAGNDTLEGGTENDFLVGGQGVDSLLGGDGNDFIYLGDSQGGNDTGGDVVSGGNGDDDIFGTSVADKLFGNADNDSLVGYVGNDGLDGSTGNDTLFGGQGIDTLLGGDGNDFIYLSDFQGGNDTGGDLVSGGNGDDDIFGTSVADKLFGNADNDSLAGYVGNDSLDGSTGNDTLIGGQGVDTLLGGDGNDRIFVSDFEGAADTGGDSIRGGNGDDTIFGSSAADRIEGDADNDSLEGVAGNDTLFGQAGNDTITGEDGDDTLHAGTVFNGAVANTVYYDRLNGDIVFGNGEEGADTFVFETPTTANKAIEFVPGSGNFVFNAGAIIGDFNIASDTIQLSGSMVGDGDNLLEGVVEDLSAGGTFDKNAEMVIFRADSTALMSQAFNLGVLTAFSATAVTTVIDDANANFAIGDKRLFVIDDGNASAVFQFVSANADAVVDVGELFLITVVDAFSTPITGLTASDFVLG
jgi:Ca2+-binding RTX toxin-like protein